MTTGLKKSLLFSGGVVILLVIATILALALVDTDSHKARIDAIASDATGLDVRIRGTLRISLFPFGVSAQDVHVSGKGGQVLVVERIGVGLKLLPLLRLIFTHNEGVMRPWEEVAGV